MEHDLRRQPGEWVSQQAARRSRRVWLACGLLIAITVASLGFLISGRIGVVGSLVVLGVLVSVRCYAERLVDDALPWMGGAAAEVAVGTELDKLGAEGFTIEHDIDRLGAGNVDHLVCGPTGAFMIETKRSGYRMSDLLTARRRAAKLHDLLGVWVTPVICIHRRRGNPFTHERVWIVPRDRLLEWLRSQHNKPVAADQLAQALRRL
jgi:hypothetical protein